MPEQDGSFPGYEGAPPDVASRITALIRRRELGPGDPLPTEGELSRLLRASRSSVREAMKTLSALDVVEVRHGHGSYVGPMTLAPLAQVLLLRSRVNPSGAPGLLAEIVWLLHRVEDGLAPTIQSGLTGEQRDTLAALAATVQERAAMALPFQEVCRSFHLALLAPAASQLAGQLAATLWDLAATVAAEQAVDPAFAGLARGVVADTHRALARATALGPAELRVALADYYLGDPDLLLDHRYS